MSERVRKVGLGQERRAEGQTTRADQSIRHGGSKLAVNTATPPWWKWRGRFDRQVIQMLERHMTVPKGFGAGDPFKVLPFQKDLLADLWGNPDTRTLVTSIARGNAKTTLPAAVGVAVLHLDPHHPHIPVVSVTRDKARELVDVAVEIIDASPELRSRSHWYASDYEIRVPATGGRMFAIAANKDSAQGFDPTLAMIDELGFIDPDVFTAMIGALGKRPYPGSRLWAFGTPGWDKSGVMWQYRKAWFDGNLATSGSFIWKEWAADPDLEVTDERAWFQANPMLQAGLMDKASLAMLAHGGMSEADFRTFRLGQWTARVDQAVDPAEWAELADHSMVLVNRTPVALALVGGQHDHATAIVAAELDRPAVHLIGLWERPEGDRAWRAPRSVIFHTFRDAMNRLDVHVARVHPAGWRSELEQWQAEYGDRAVVEYSVSRRQVMAPASDRFLTALDNQALTHDGHSDLARHATAAVTESTPDGRMIRQDERNQAHQGRVEGLLATVAALDAAVELEHTRSGRFVY